MCRFKCDPLPNLVTKSISVFLIFDVQLSQMVKFFFVFQTHNMCYRYVVCIFFTSDRILHRQTLVLRCALAPDADADVKKIILFIGLDFDNLLTQNTCFFKNLIPNLFQELPGSERDPTDVAGNLLAVLLVHV